MKTLAIRMERSQENAMKVAEFLANHPKIAWIKYRFNNTPSTRISKKQMKGLGGDDFGLRRL